ncbi:hypothetical protein AB834_06710 [PVC group bacterium (ex Bugula neritina AB1)]|nr:hypothetical protein AB834_06710 [PVC group bacterium (ex Bugula neritina AB1)]
MEPSLYLLAKGADSLSFFGRSLLKKKKESSHYVDILSLINRNLIKIFPLKKVLCFFRKDSCPHPYL